MFLALGCLLLGRFSSQLSTKRENQGRTLSTRFHFVIFNKVIIQFRGISQSSVNLHFIGKIRNRSRKRDIREFFFILFNFDIYQNHKLYTCNFVNYPMKQCHNRKIHVSKIIRSSLATSQNVRKQNNLTRRFVQRIRCIIRNSRYHQDFDEFSTVQSYSAN